MNLTLVGSTRTGDIVRGADILHSYKRAGVIRFLLGIERYEAAMLETIKKGTTTSDDRQAIQLLRRHGILSMATYVLGTRLKDGTLTLRRFRGGSLAANEASMVKRRRPVVPIRGESAQSHQR